MASRSLGALTLDLIAKTGGYVGGLSKAERESEKWRRKTQKQIKDVSRNFALLGTAAAAGLIAVTKNTIDSAREIQNFARIANTGSEEFQRITFAADRFGVSQEKTADILKDVSDKVGDFLQTGGGPLADFFENIAPRVGVTADQFRDLSGPQALGLYVSSLEKANVSQNEMTFFMEAIASDATLLLPLLKDNGKELGKLSAQADKFGVVLSDIDIQRLEEVRQSIDDTKAIFKGLTNEVALGALPAIEDFTALLSDEQTIEAARTLGKAIGDSFIFITKAIRGTIEVTKFLAEEMSSNLFGPAIDDADRVSERIAALSETIKALEPLALSRPGDKNISDQLISAREELDKYNKALAFYSSLSKATAPSIETPDPVKTNNQADTFVPPSAAATRFIEELKLQKELLGKSKIEAELYKLELGKASPEQLKLAESLLRSVDAFEKQTDAAKESSEQIAQINKDALDIQSSLRSEEQVIEDSYKRRRDIILVNTEVTGEARNALLAKLDQDREDALANTSEQSGLRAEMDRINQQAQAIADGLLSEEEKIQESYARRRDIVLRNTEITGQAQTELMAELEEERLEKLNDLETSKNLITLQNQELLFNNLSGLAKTFAGEQSGIYKAIFAVEKTIGIARSIIAIQAGIAQASANPFPENLAAMATVASATASIVSTIQGTSIEGVAHDGLDRVPTTGTYLLEQGERVTTERTSAKLDRTLDNVQRGGTGSPEVKIRNINVFDKDEVVGGYMGSDDGEQKIMNAIKKNPTVIKQLAKG